MILKDIANYIQERKIVSLHELALHFRSDPFAVEAMVQRWVEKKMVERIVMDAGSCGGCTMCPGDIKIHYRWLGASRPQTSQIVKNSKTPSDPSSWKC